MCSCLGSEENSELKAKTIDWGKMSSQQVVMRILEDITTDMAVSIPLALIGNWILQEFSSAQFAYFRSSLLGLLAAHSYEHNILQVIAGNLRFFRQDIAAAIAYLGL